MRWIKEFTPWINMHVFISFTTSNDIKIKYHNHSNNIKIILKLHISLATRKRCFCYFVAEMLWIQRNFRLVKPHNLTQPEHSPRFMCKSRNIYAISFIP